jgi:hypothetical protein
VKKARWIAFPVPYTDAVILASASKGRLSGMIYNPLVNRPPDPWRHDCPHCQQDTSTRWPLKARKALRMFRLATVKSGSWELELAPDHAFRGKLGEDGWKGIVAYDDGREIEIKQTPGRPPAHIAGTRANKPSKLASRNLKLILMARMPMANEIEACLASLADASQGVRRPPLCRKMKLTT